MKTFYYDIDNSRFLDSAGDWIPQCVPELFYQEHAEWKIVLRDGGNAPVDFSRIAVWGAAVADDFRTDTAPMCRTQNEGIAADTNSGEVTVSLDCATEEFLACVTGASEKSARFELYGLDSSGRRLISIGFDIRVRMTLDPDPGIDVHTPDTVATKAFVSAYVHQSGALTSGAEIDTTVGEYHLTYTASGGLMISGGGVALQVSSGSIVASGGSDESMVLSGGTVRVAVGDPVDSQGHVIIDSDSVSIAGFGPTNGAGLLVGPGEVAVTGNNGNDGVDFTINGRPVLTELATSTDSETTSASFEVLSGGTKYVYIRPLTALVIDSVESDCRAAFDFTAGSGFDLALPFGAKKSGDTFVAGSSYIVTVDGEYVSATEYKQDTQIGVWVMEGGAIVSSGMTMTDAVVSSGQSMYVYSRGAAIATTVDGGSAYVNSGGSARNLVLATGRVGNRAVVVTPFIRGGEYYNYSNGVTSNATITSGGNCYLQLPPTEPGGGMIHGVSMTGVAKLFLQASGCGVSGGECNGEGTIAASIIYAYNGAFADDITLMSAAQLRISSGAVGHRTLIESNGQVFVYSGGVVVSTVVSSGGTLYVSSGASALDVTSSAGAVVTVAEGGYIEYVTP